MDTKTELLIEELKSVSHKEEYITRLQKVRLKFPASNVNPVNEKWDSHHDFSSHSDFADGRSTPEPSKILSALRNNLSKLNKQNSDITVENPLNVTT